MPIRSRPRSGRRLAAALLATVLAAVTIDATLAPASRADDDATLTVVGTSDVYDSNLVQSVLKPGFEAAYPQYTLNYISKGTGAAIAYAEAGTASALIVHAASLENQFVGAGYSAETYGRAIFWGDYVLLGPTADPAGVFANDPHDVVGAFQRIAAAGAAGNANFVSRGGTPGTTVQEHAIWKLTSGLTTCTVSDANGGGTSPSTTSGDCPSSISYPTWYHATGLTQGPNILNASTCNYGNSVNNCYVLTDRGTFNYLQSTNQATNLKVVVRDNAVSATGGSSLLVNSFHAYAVNPAKFTDPTVRINSAAATAFLNWVTSPAGQAKVGAYLNGSNDPPFIPSAAPTLSAPQLTPGVTGSQKLTLSGTLKNVTPGTPALNAVTVSLKAVPLATPGAAGKTIATAVTSSTGGFTMSLTPRISRSYTLSVPSITKVENSALNPVFGDILAPSSLSVGDVAVTGKVTISSATRSARQLTIRGAVDPASWSSNAHLSLYRGHPGDPLEYVEQRSLGAAATTFTKKFTFPRGTWTYQLRDVDSGYILPGLSAPRTVTIP